MASRFDIYIQFDLAFGPGIAGGMMYNMTSLIVASCFDIHNYMQRSASVVELCFNRCIKVYMFFTSTETTGLVRDGTVMGAC